MDIISDESLFYKKLNSLFLVYANLLIYIDVWENNFTDISLRQRMTKQRHTVLFIQISHHDFGCNQRFNYQDTTTLSVVGKMLYDCNKPYFFHHLFNYIIIHFFQLPSIIIIVKSSHTFSSSSWDPHYEILSNLSLGMVGEEYSIPLH